jgi:DNA-binding transcriptional MerR regulator
MKKVYLGKLDEEWVELILSAKQLGLSIQEIKEFLGRNVHEEKLDTKYIV